MVLVFSSCGLWLLLVYHRTGRVYSRGSGKVLNFDMNSSLLMDPCKILHEELWEIQLNTKKGVTLSQHKLTLWQKALDGLLWGNNFPLSHTHALDKECILSLSVFPSVLLHHIKYSLTFDSEPRQFICCSPSLCSNMLSQSPSELGCQWLFLSHWDPPCASQLPPFLSTSFSLSN